MGKDYGAVAYKKTYEGDYSKEYKNARQLNALRQEKAREYEIASKKIGTRSYNKSEKGIVARPTTHGEVTASGPGRVQRVRPLNSTETEYKQKVYPQAPQSVKPAPPPTPRQQDRVETAKIPTPPPIAQTRSERTEPVKITPPPTRKVAEKPVVKLSPLAIPIQVQPDSTYKDLTTGARISVDAARKKLLSAGFYKIESGYNNTILFFVFVFGVFFPFIGPLALFSMGSGLKKKTMATYERFVEGRRQVYDMPAENEDLQKFKSQGGLFTAVAFIAGAVQYYFIFL